MKQIPITEFKKLSVSELKELPCLELTADGEPVAIVVIGATAEMRTQIESRCSQIDAALGKR